ncbi:MAG TPA: sigma-54 dependent transcriptional regulator [Geobacteraceae bacterium]|nr:sigma-54 dependent transcriptional regulator [Geobacteraceae bacterium]
MKDKASILLIDDEESSRQALILLLKGSYNVTGAGNGHEARQRLAAEQFDIVITDLRLPDCSGIDILKQIKQYSPTTEVILITGHASAETAVSAMKEGASDYITKPVNMEELRIILAKAMEKRQLLSENIYLKKQLFEKYGFANIIGNSPAMQNVFRLMQRIIKTDSTVLIMGESGTGKEIVAKSIHFNSPRKDKPFVAVHCGAIPETLLESELFGHAKGAFTGAVREKIGKFESANRGTIFLDEIGTMPLHLQIKLLRVLQEQEIERVGSNSTVKLDVRVIAATNLSLEEEVKNGRFREDLFYRLNVIPLIVPPLRERKEDIIPLTRYFLTKFCKEMNRGEMNISRQAMESLEMYPWPGNVRELENAVERLVALTESESITIADLPDSIGKQHGNRLSFTYELDDNSGLDFAATISEIETQIINRALARTDNVKARTAALLRMNRTTLVEKMKRLGIGEN